MSLCLSICLLKLSNDGYYTRFLIFYNLKFGNLANISYLCRRKRTKTQNFTAINGRNSHSLPP